MLDEPRAQVDRFLHVVLRGRRKPGLRMDEEEGHLARHQFERDVVKPQDLLETVQCDNDRVVSVGRGHDLEDRGKEKLLVPSGKD